jgi:transposase IS116/IS110/IS902 family protein
MIFLQLFAGGTDIEVAPWIEGEVAAGGAADAAGKLKLGRISKMGDRYLRKLLVVGAHAVLFHRKPHTDPLRMWAKKADRVLETSNG